MTPFTIQFHSNPATEVLRLTKDGIWANPDIPVDDAAKLVLAAIGGNIEILVQKAVLSEREACAKLCDDIHDEHEARDTFSTYADAIRARGEA